MPSGKPGRYCSAYCQREGRTKMFSKAEAEDNEMDREHLAHVYRTMLLDGQIDGFQLNTLMAGLEAEERKDKGRLFVTRTRLQERDELRKQALARPK